MFTLLEQAKVEGREEMSTDLRPSDSHTFNYIQSDVAGWRGKADVLVDTAYKLEADRDPEDSPFINFRFRNVYNMLIGFALENYYKGAIIANKLKNGEQIEAHKLNSSINHHKLAKLVSDAGVMVKDRLHESYQSLPIQDEPGGGIDF